LDLLRHLVTVGVPPPVSTLTSALPFSGPSSQDQPSFQFTSPQLQVPQSFQSPSYMPIQTGFTPSDQPHPHMLTDTPFIDLSATYSELTGQPMPLHTTFATPSGLSASEAAFLLVTGTGTTETVPSSVASTDPPAFGSLQAQVTETAPLVATSVVPVPADQTQTASQSRASSEGQPDSSESEGDTSQFVITTHSLAPDSTPSVPPSDP
jgi:cystathionine beta-lyase/cystathionine gamma-synthase